MKARVWPTIRPGAGSRAIASAFLLLVAAALMPMVNLPRHAYDYVVIFDISQSMHVEDYEVSGSPVSRLTYAREAARRVLRDLPCGSRVGWGAFTGYRSILLLAPVEICEHYSDLLAALDQIDGRMRWSNASEITKGLYWAILAAQQTQSKPDVVFISDGHEAPPLDPSRPLQMLEDLQVDPIRGWIIGTGGYAPSPIPRIDEDGRRHGYWRADEVVQPFAYSGEAPAPAIEHLSAVHETHLRELAGRIGLQYVRLDNHQSLSAAMRDERLARRRPGPTQIGWIPLTAALVLLAIRFRPERLRV